MRGSKGILGRQWAGRERKHDGCSADASEKLRNAVKHETERADDAGQEQRQADIRVEQAASDPVEQPRRHEQSQSERGRAVHDMRHIRRRRGCLQALSLRGLYAAVREHEEDGRADVLERSSEAVVSERGREQEGGFFSWDVLSILQSFSLSRASSPPWTSEERHFARRTGLEGRASLTASRTTRSRAGGGRRDGGRVRGRCD